MIAIWMLYGCAMGALVALAGYCLDRIARLAGRPARWLWAGAMAASLAIPLRVIVTADRPIQRVAAPATAAAADDRASVSALPASSLGPRTASRAARLDRPLLATWAATSLFLIGALIRATVAWRRPSVAWREAELDGVQIWVSADHGPAVGLVPMRIVLPEWALALDPTARRLMLRHEVEHVRARDPYLLLLGGIAVAMMPWNLALWWQLRQLRLALEIDCDRRVLRGERNARPYALLLLAVGERLARPARAPATALVEAPSFLSRRIRAMSATPAPRRARVAALGLVAAATIAFASQAPRPHPIVLAAARPVGDQRPTWPNRSVLGGLAGSPEWLLTEGRDAETLTHYGVSALPTPRSPHDLYAAIKREFATVGPGRPLYGFVIYLKMSIAADGRVTRVEATDDVQFEIFGHHPAGVRFFLDLAGVARRPAVPGPEVHGVPALGKQAAERVISNTRFTPAQRNGHAVPIAGFWMALDFCDQLPVMSL